MNTARTQGSWWYDEELNAVVTVVGPRVVAVADFGKIDCPEANARLIAAAPELLEALRDALNLIDDLMPGVRHIPLQDYAALNNTPIKARAVIAKATGGTL